MQKDWKRTKKQKKPIDPTSYSVSLPFVNQRTSYTRTRTNVPRLEHASFSSHSPSRSSVTACSAKCITLPESFLPFWKFQSIRQTEESRFFSCFLFNKVAAVKKKQIYGDPAGALIPRRRVFLLHQGPVQVYSSRQRPRLFFHCRGRSSLRRRSPQWRRPLSRSG